jgi:hypothetical protein
VPVLDFFLNDISPVTKNLRFDVGATLPVLRVRVMDENDPVSLAGGTATFTMKDKDGNAKILNAAAIIEGDGTSGIVRYEWTIADTDVARIYFAQFTITLAGDDLIVPNDADQVLRIVMGKADFQRGTVIQQPVAQGVQVVALGGTPTLDAIGRWFKVVVSALDFTAAAVEEVIDLFQLPPGGIVEAIKAKHSEAFAGGGISAYTAKVGSAAEPQKYMSPFDVFSAPSSTNHKVATSGDEESHDAATPIKVTATATGGNVGDGTAGTVEIWIKASTVLGSGGLLFSDGFELQDDGAGVAGGPFKIINFKDFNLIVDEGGGIVAVTAPSGNLPADDVTLENAAGVLRAKDDGISDAKLRNSAALSVIGRAAGSIGNPADIVAAADNRVLARASDALAFQQVIGAMIANLAVTAGKIANKTIGAAQLNEAVSANRGFAGNDEEKTTDTTLAAATELSRSLVANQTLSLDIELWVEVDSINPGFKFDLNYTGSENFIFYTVEEAGPDWNSFNNENQNGLFDSFNNQRSFSMASGSSLHLIRIRGIMQDDGGGGTLQIRWAQATSSGDAARLKAASFINGLPY